MYVRHFYLTNKEGGQGFTDEDEETLVLLASQVATAIAKTKAYRDEQRAPCQALVDTSPNHAGRRSRVNLLGRGRQPDAPAWPKQ